MPEMTFHALEREARHEPPQFNPADQGRERAEAVSRLDHALREIAQRYSDLPVLAIWWMHLCHPLRGIQAELVREAMHPASEGPWDLGQPRRRFVVGIVWCLIYGGYLLLSLVRLRLLLRRELRALRAQSFSIVARSCCYQSDRRTDGTDFYCGDLQARLARRGVSMLLLCGNVSGESWRMFAKRHTSTDGLCRVPDLALVSPFSVVTMVVRQLINAVRLARSASHASDPFTATVGRLASLEALTPGTTITGLLAWVGHAAVQWWHPRVVMTLYEGYGWEKCLRRGVKAADPSCLAVGYQHTAMFRESLAMLAPEDEHAWSVPDVVLGLGHVPLEMLREGHAHRGTSLIPFGSFRYQPEIASHPADPMRRTVLVTPVGHRPEVKTLFEFAYRCAKRLPSYTFILRCHPEVPMAMAQRLVDVDLTTLPNLVLSNRSIEEDFQRASVLLYRGSSAVFYAVLQGLLPIYVDLDTEMDRDPLFQLTRWRRRCASVEACVQILREHEQASDGQLAETWAAAAAYVNEYTGPVTDDRLNAFLEAVGLNGDPA